MGAKELIELIKKEDLLRFFFELELEYLTEDWDFYTSEDETFSTEEEAKEFLTKLGLQNYQGKGSREDTSEFWNVTYFPDHDIYIKISGWFDSYGQYEHTYDNIEEVKPKTIETIIYE